MTNEETVYSMSVILTHCVGYAEEEQTRTNTSQDQKSTDLQIFLAHTHNCGINMDIQSCQLLKN